MLRGVKNIVLKQIVTNPETFLSESPWKNPAEQEFALNKHSIAEIFKVVAQSATTDSLLGKIYTAKPLFQQIIYQPKEAAAEPNKKHFYNAVETWN